MTTTTYSVNLWQADPRSGEDACSSGYDYSSLAEARGAFEAFARGQVPAHLGDDLVEADADRWAFITERAGRFLAGATHVELAEGTRDGRDDAKTLEVARTPHAAKLERRFARQAEQDDLEWRRERATQAGMGLGVEAFNDEMGSSPVARRPRYVALLTTAQRDAACEALGAKLAGPIEPEHGDHLPATYQGAQEALWAADAAEVVLVLSGAEARWLDWLAGDLLGDTDELRSRLGRRDFEACIRAANKLGAAAARTRKAPRSE